MKNNVVFLRKIKKLKILSLICFSFSVLLLMGSAPVWAHTVTIDEIEIDGVGSSVAVEHEHNDADPWKGWLTVEVTNTGEEAWGDFHFGIFQIPGQGTVEDVHFDVSANEPTSSQSGLSWVVDNVSVGATLDLYFYSDPVLPTEAATFSVYTDNTEDHVNFGVCFYPTSVPIPSAIWLLGFGFIGLAGFRKKFRT